MRIEQQNAALHECEDKFAQLLPTVDRPCIDSLLQDSAALHEECDANVNLLRDLQTEIEQHDVHAPLPTSISAIHHQWSHLITKVHSHWMRLVDDVP